MSAIDDLHDRMVQEGLIDEDSIIVGWVIVVDAASRDDIRQLAVASSEGLTSWSGEGMLTQAARMMGDDHPGCTDGDAE